jgi:ubiquinone/menaquinone biosynthesis C-methylase UbiE
MKPENWVQRFYAKRASVYERLFVDFLGWGRELEFFFRRSDYIQPNFKVLDAGCGTGVVTRILYRLAREQGFEGITFHAFDLTQNMLDIFQQWIVAHGANNIELKQADVLETKLFPSNWKDYDFIVSSTMLEYLPKDKIKDALVNLNQLLRKGGTFLVFLTKRNILTRWFAEKWWKTNLYDQSEVQTLFLKAGFDEIAYKNFSSRWSKFIMVIEAKK